MGYMLVINCYERPALHRSEFQPNNFGSHFHHLSDGVPIFTKGSHFGGGGPHSPTTPGLHKQNGLSLLAGTVAPR